MIINEKYENIKLIIITLNYINSFFRDLLILRF